MSQVKVGEAAERRVVRWLKWRWYRVLATRVRLGGGELDIVAMRGHTLHIIEVKARRVDWARARDAVCQRKRARILCATRVWLCRAPPEVQRVSFDIAEVRLGLFSRVRLLKDAYRADEVVGGSVLCP